jgi:hypothetical protein
LCSWVFNDFRCASRANSLCGEWASGIEDGGAFMPSALQPGYPLRTRRTFRQDGLDQRFAQKLDAGVALTVVHDSVFYVSRRIDHSERRQNFADRSASLRPARRHVRRACRRPHQRPQTWPLIWRAALRRSPSPNKVADPMELDPVGGRLWYEFKGHLSMVFFCGAASWRASGGRGCSLETYIPGAKAGAR